MMVFDKSILDFWGISFETELTTMFNPELHQKTNSVPRRAVSECLQKFADRLNLRNGCRVMDLGCGDGSITTAVLKQVLPEDFEELIGTDISQQMVKHANREHGDHKTSFAVWDMSSEAPREYVDRFDLVFSSYAVHWVQKQEAVFSNVIKLLKDNGQCLLVFIAYTPIYSVYRMLARNPRWSQWLGDVERYISPYQDIPDPETAVTEIMSKVGFRNIYVKCEGKTHLYEEPEFRSTMQAVCPFEVPTDQHSAFMDDYVRAARHCMVVTEVEEKILIRINYTLLVVYGAKK